MPEESELTPEIAKQLLGLRDLNDQQVESEPPIEGLPPKDKPVSEWTEAESAAAREAFERAMRERMKREERERREEAERIEAEAMLTPEQQHQRTIAAMLSPEAKRKEHQALIDSIHPKGEEDL